jgi:hypothetical protein
LGICEIEDGAVIWSDVMVDSHTGKANHKTNTNTQKILEGTGNLEMEAFDFERDCSSTARGVCRRLAKIYCYSSSATGTKRSGMEGQEYMRRTFKRTALREVRTP